MLEVSETERDALSAQSQLVDPAAITRVLEALTDCEIRLRNAASKRILVEGKQTLKLVASKSTLGLEAAVLDVTTDFFTGISKATRKNDTKTGGEI